MILRIEMQEKLIIFAFEKFHDAADSIFQF